MLLHNTDTVARVAKTNYSAVAPEINSLAGTEHVSKNTWYESTFGL